MNGSDTYREPITFEFSNAIVRVYRPILDDAERERRMKMIRDAAEKLLIKKKG